VDVALGSGLPLHTEGMEFLPVGLVQTEHTGDRIGLIGLLLRSGDWKIAEIV
jgi:hypothetical protein